LDRGRRFRPAQAPPDEPDDMRRKMERVVVFAEAAEELARAAQSVLIAAEAEPSDFYGTGLAALCAALARYREARDG
jgi:hypothetical protein